jgi:GcrA cell cycle regulator
MYPRTVKNFDWPDETVERLTKMWADGLSATIIAMRIGHGLTRNSVIGKAYRLELPSRTTTSKMLHGKASARRRRRPPIVTAKPLTPLQKLIREGSPLPPRAETDVARVSFDDFERHKHCAFIPGDPADDFKSDKPMYCGLPSVPGIAYCQAHARRCFDAPRTSASNRAYLLRDEQHAAHVTPKVFA